MALLAAGVLLVALGFCATESVTEDPDTGVWVALDAYSDEDFWERSLLPMGRLRPDGSWDLPWPRPFLVSQGHPPQGSLIPLDATGVLVEPSDRPGDLRRPGVSWLLPYEVTATGRRRIVAPLRWHRYGMGLDAADQPTPAERLGFREGRECSFWTLQYDRDVEGGAPAGLALSRQPLAVLGEDDLPGLDDMLTAVGLSDRPADTDGGYQYEGDPRHSAGRYPRRTVVGLARLREDLDVALVRYEEAGPRFDGHAASWALVEMRNGNARTVSTFSGDPVLCVGRPASNLSEALWVALVKHDGSRLDPVARRHPDGRWDVSWPDEDILGGSLDSAGFLESRPGGAENIDPVASGSAPFGLADGDRIRLDAPLHWYRHSRSGRRYPGTVSHAMLAERHCGAGWALRMDPAANWLWDDYPGVALSHPQATWLAEEEVPNLADIRAELSLLDQPSDDQGGYTMGGPRYGSRYPNRDVLGLFRLEDGVVFGVVWERHYEGERAVVFAIAGDSARVVASSYLGGC